MYLAPALQAKVDVAQAAGFRLSQIVDVGVDAVLGSSAGRVSRGGGPSAGAVRERVRLRSAGLRVVAPSAPLPVDANVGTPQGVRAVFQPPPDAYHPPEVPDNGGGVDE